MKRKIYYFIGVLCLIFAFFTYSYISAYKLETILAAQSQGHFFEDIVNSKFHAVSAPKDLKPLSLKNIKPVSVKEMDEGNYLVSFEKAYFGALSLNNKHNKTITLRMYETSKQHHTLLKSKGKKHGNYVGFFEDTITFSEFNTFKTISPIGRYRPSIEDLPGNVKSVMPFREVEIIGYEGILNVADIFQLAVHYPFDDASFFFDTDNIDLNRVVELARHTSVATTYSRLFIDGDRERVPYEADAYIQLLSNAAISNDYAIAEYTLNYLLKNSTWPTEWQLQTILIAHAYYMYSGDKSTILSIYNSLETKLLSPLIDERGLLSSDTDLQTESFLTQLGVTNKLQDIIDWPPSERAGYTKQRVPDFFYKTFRYYAKLLRSHIVSFFDFPLAQSEYREDAAFANAERFQIHESNSVVNMFRYGALQKFADLSCKLELLDKCDLYTKQAESFLTLINNNYYNHDAGLYSDIPHGEHFSFHSNLFALYFGLTKETRKIECFLEASGMAGSVYSSQFLLEGLFKADRSNYAIQLITNKTQRGWLYMIESLGSTMTAEAWNFEIKPNMDLNHGWGTAPLNTAVRYLAGIRPIEPGFERFVIAPKRSGLRKISSKTPTPKGVVSLHLETLDDSTMKIDFTIPLGSIADIVFPVDLASSYTIVKRDTKEVVLKTGENVLANVRPGHYAYTIQFF